MVVVKPPQNCWNKLEDVKLILSIGFGCNCFKTLWPKKIILLFLAKNVQKWHFQAITAKSEENRLCLKFNFTSSRVPQKILGVLQLPYLETRIFKNQKNHRDQIHGA